jgi:Drexlerviridae HNH endonuclease
MRLMKTVKLNFKRAKELFRYDPNTGKLYWKSCTSNRIRVGDEVGNIFGSRVKYFQTSVDGVKMLNHRIIWLLQTGKMPKFEIGHEDGNGLNNKWKNLADVSSTRNNMNLSKRSDNSSGFTGIAKHSTSAKWVVQAQLNGKYIYGGLFKNLEDAIKVRKQLNKKYGFHKNHGRLKHFSSLDAF